MKNLHIRMVTLSLALRWVGLGLAVVLTVAAMYLWRQQVRMEEVLRYTCDLPTFALIEDNCLERVPAPVNRKFEAVSDVGAVVGRWTTHAVRAGELVHTAHLTTASPERFRFASGEVLPEGLYGYYLAAPKPVLQVTVPGDLLTLNLADARARQLGVLLDKAPVLHADTDGIFLGLTPMQVGALEGLLAELRVQERESSTRVFVWLITQGANPSLPPLSAVTLDLQGLGGTR